MVELNDNLVPIFIFSLPRSGSTLLQRILATHEDIATVAESHLLLPYFYTLRPEGVYSEYYHAYTAYGIRGFCLELPNDTEDYLREIRALALRLYTKAAKRKVSYFVDKAGAYHLIVEEIIQMFPEGKFIFLWRNPLAVASSLMKSWSDGKWNLYNYERRLYQGLPQLLAAYEKYKNHVHAVCYEELITNPGKVSQGIFDYLQLAFDTEIISQYTKTKFKGGTGDVVGMRQYQKLSSEPLEKWKVVLANPIRKAWARSYLNYIGKERLSTMGYDLEELVSTLNNIPFSLRYISSDIVRIPCGFAFRMFEGKILKDKLRAIRSGQRVYMHT